MNDWDAPAGDGALTARPADPGDLLSFANEKYVEETETAAEDYAAEGLTDLEVCAQYCRACTVSVQRLFHVRSLGEVCREAMRTGNEAFPLDLIEELAQDDDSEVRQMVAEQLGILGEALQEARCREEDDVAAGLLCVAFLLVEDDVDGVVSAAEAAVAPVAALLEGDEGRELVLTQIANLSTGEEEEIRMSGAKIIGSLAATLGAETAARRLAPLLIDLGKDETLQIREAAVHSITRVGETMRHEEFEDILAPSFCELTRDGVWTVRKACAEEITALSKCVSSETFTELAPELFEPMANDVSFQVRAAGLESLGPLIAELGREYASESLVDHFVSMAESAGGPGGLQLACAYNFPGVALTIGYERWGEIRDAYLTLSSSVDWRVRRTLACSMHEIAKILDGETAEADLLPVFEDMLCDTDEVSLGAVNHLAEFTRELSPKARMMHLRLLPGVGVTDRKDSIGNWRLRAAMAGQLETLSSVLPASANEETILPMLLRLLRDPASAVRSKAVAATGGVLRNTTRNSKETWRMGPVGKMVSEIKLMATRPRWTDRQAYIQLCASFVGVVDASVVIEELLPLMLMASEDAVPNVRRSLAEALAKFGEHPAYASLPDLRDAIGALRNDHDADVAQTALTRCAYDSRERVDGLGFASTGLRSPLR